MMNPANIFKMKGLWERFTQNHPKFPMFLKAAGSSNLGEGTIIEVHITTADQKELSTNVKLTQEDLELIAQMKELVK